MPNSSSSSSSLSGKILLLDDNSMGMSARRSVLEELGHKVVTSGAPHDALELCGKQRFDVVVTDYKMPKMDGVEFIARLRKNHPAGHQRDSDLGFYRHAGAQRSEHRRRRRHPEELPRSQSSDPFRKPSAAEATTTNAQTPCVPRLQTRQAKNEITTAERMAVKLK
jgi:CheY-like chemotaxis protein